MTHNKLFASAFAGSLYGKPQAVWCVWVYVIANMRPRGEDFYVELNPVALAPLFAATVEAMQAAIADLCAVDMHSRTPAERGRRLVPEGRVRELGPTSYRVVNGRRYRDKRDDEQRRLQVRDAVRRYRKREKEAVIKPDYSELTSDYNGLTVIEVSQCKPRTEDRGQRTEEQKTEDGATSAPLPLPSSKQKKAKDKSKDQDESKAHDKAPRARGEDEAMLAAKERVARAYVERTGASIKPAYGVVGKRLREGVSEAELLAALDWIMGPEGAWHRAKGLHRYPRTLWAADGRPLTEARVIVAAPEPASDEGAKGDGFVAWLKALGEE